MIYLFYFIFNFIISFSSAFANETLLPPVDEKPAMVTDESQAVNPAASSIQSLRIDAKPEAMTTETPAKDLSAEKKESVVSLSEVCLKDLKKFPGKFDEDMLAKVCAKATALESCKSVESVPLYHYDKKGTDNEPQNILVFSLIHGDETSAGSVVRFWMERLEKIEPRNNWRVIPILNPDGVKYKTRVNANKVDINRNFPTKDWTEKALSYWKKETNSNPRRFPGNEAGSEPETNCALKHIQDFKPDFIVSIHTPLKVLDFDGPKIKPPKFDYLPWKSLGSFPGSLGRLMWLEQKIPVLTLEAKEDYPANSKPWIQLQDIIGYLVSLETKNKNNIKK